MTIKEYLLELKKYSPYDFSEYSDSSMQRRINKILQEHKMSMEELVKKAKEDSQFMEELVNLITVNTTDFFRDPQMWTEYFKHLYSAYKSKRQLHIWHAGSSTGQEVYTNLILLHKAGLLNKSNVLATDINQRVLHEAEKGNYRHSSNTMGLHKFIEYLKKEKNELLPAFNFMDYMEPDSKPDAFQFSGLLRSVPDFKKHDLVKALPPTDQKFDIIFCRNVLIYFNIELQMRILKMLHDQMVTGGILILGNHESVTGFFKTKFTKKDSFFVKNNAFHLKW
jgi:chemotaxis protein methyltransferase CheR